MYLLSALKFQSRDPPAAGDHCIPGHAPFMPTSMLLLGGVRPKRVPQRMKLLASIGIPPNEGLKQARDSAAPPIWSFERLVARLGRLGMGDSDRSTTQAPPPEQLISATAKVISCTESSKESSALLLSTSISPSKKTANPNPPPTLSARKVSLRKASPRVLTPEETSEARMRGLAEGQRDGQEEEGGSETTEPFDVLRNIDKGGIRSVSLF